MIRHEVDEVRNKVICTEVMRLRDLTARAGRLTETRTSFALTLVLFAYTAGKEQKRLYGTASVCVFFWGEQLVSVISLRLAGFFLSMCELYLDPARALARWKRTKMAVARKVSDLNWSCE